ncbi:uncharacterized protein LOC62_02G003408 [Vanrija pseudolonga]|uniref:Uncharacterized protein n=1 Tax=Vanrija pseudolonga TaxID=143232 RepID=A0AAF0Y499_9TREE|nr:hypothetical protein LOC62_02G003408 [Vanrija pseudolonga]
MAPVKPDKPQLALAAYDRKRRKGELAVQSSHLSQSQVIQLHANRLAKEIITRHLSPPPVDDVPPVGRPLPLPPLPFAVAAERVAPVSAAVPLDAADEEPPPSYEETSASYDVLKAGTFQVLDAQRDLKASVLRALGEQKGPVPQSSSTVGTGGQGERPLPVVPPPTHGAIADLPSRAAQGAREPEKRRNALESFATSTSPPPVPVPYSRLVPEKERQRALEAFAIPPPKRPLTTDHQGDGDGDGDVRIQHLEALLALFAPQLGDVAVVDTAALASLARKAAGATEEKEGQGAG